MAMEFHEAMNQDPQHSEAGTAPDGTIPDGIRVIRKMRDGHTYETITEETRITDTQQTVEHVDIDYTPMPLSDGSFFAGPKKVIEPFLSPLTQISTSLLPTSYFNLIVTILHSPRTAS